MAVVGVPPRWAEKYLAIPFLLNGASIKGCDCVGLCQLVTWQEKKIWVTREDIEVGDLRLMDPDTVKDFVGRAPWTTILAPGEEKPFDWVLMHGLVGRHLAPVHVGIVTAPGWLLHVDEDNLSRQQSFRHLHQRIILIARHDRLI